MDIGDFQNNARIVITVVSFLTFLGIMYWTFSGRRKDSFEEAANLPFDHDDELPMDQNSSVVTQTKRNAS